MSLVGEERKPVNYMVIIHNGKPLKVTENQMRILLRKIEGTGETLEQAIERITIEYWEGKLGITLKKSHGVPVLNFNTLDPYLMTPELTKFK